MNEKKKERKKFDGKEMLLNKDCGNVLPLTSCLGSV